jgi:nucleoside-diphosphate-sugar epimerase
MGPAVRPRGVTAAAAPAAIVLGGTGYVGRHVCAALGEAGYEVLAVARRSAPLPRGCRMLTMDLAGGPPARLSRLIAGERPHAVVNACGVVWGLDEREMETMNVGVTRRLVEAAAAVRRPPRIVQIGSIREYAPPAEGTSLDEDAPPGPIDAYGRTKLAATEAVLAAAASGAPPGVALRLANVAGPGAPAGSLLGLVAGRLMDAAERGGKAVVELHPLRARRDYVDVRDIADAVALAARSELTGLVLNIGRGEAVPVRSLVDLLIEVSGVPAEVVERGPDEGGPRPDRIDVTWQRTDPGRAARLLGWRPRRSLEESVRAFWLDARRRRAAARPGRDRTMI